MRKLSVCLMALMLMATVSANAQEYTKKTVKNITEVSS